MRLALALLTCLAANLMPLPAAAQDSATIVNSGSTNSVGWKLTIHTDGSGSVIQATRGVPAQGQSARSFSVTRELATKFFRDLRAARDAQIAGVACM